MKYFITAILFFTASFASAQIVNIPDPQFKDAMIGLFDTNGDHEIEVSEAQAVTSFRPLSQLSFFDLTGINAFINVDSVHIWSPYNMTNLDLSGMVGLKWLNANVTFAQTVNLSGCSNLNYVDLSASGLNSATHITSLNLGGDNKLSYLNCGMVNLASLDLTTLDSLVSFFTMSSSSIQSLNISGMTKFKNLYVDGDVASLSAANCTGLLRIRANTNIANLLDLTGCTSLKNIEIGSYLPSSLDLSTCTALDSLRIFHPDNLTSLNIKNGRAFNYMYLYLEPNGPPLNICADEIEVAPITDLYHNLFNANAPVYNTVSVNSFCSSFPGGNYNTIKGKIRLDGNANGCDDNDPGMLNVPIRFTDGSGNSMVRYTGFYGDYRHYPYAGNFNILPYFPYPFFNVSPTSSNISFATANNLIDSANFCITPNGTHNQLEVTLVPWEPALTGFASTYDLHYRNRGTTTLSGNILLSFDNNKMTFVNASELPSSQSTGLLNWNYTNLAPFEDRYITVQLMVLPAPINNIGDTLQFLSVINPIANDETPSNNSFVLVQSVVGSYDPNDKECLEGAKIDIDHASDYLHYVIHFQNLGTAAASNVMLADTLSDKFDWKSFDLLGSSFPCDVQRKDNKLQFYFNNIQLPYASMNEAASHGYVAFKIKPKNTVAIGDSLNNRASIYFDFNPPVVTDLATTVVVPTVSLAVKLQYFSLVSKDETNQLVWKASPTTGITDFGIERSNDGIHFSNIGNITATPERCQSPFNFTDEKPFDGKTYYRLNIKDANGISLYSKVLLAERTKSGLSIITAIVSNQNNTTLYLNASKEQNVQIKIVATDGRLLYNQTKTIAAGNSSLNLQLKNLATGIYTLIVYTSEGEVVTKRFVK
ncbi:MAG: T9SS type A sorting domain-containing protein [Ferruginibacter sp.]